MDEERKPRSLDDLIGQRVHYQGQDWTVRYSEVTKAIVLERPVDVEPMLRAMRDGALVLQGDPAEFAAQPMPSTREACGREWRILDAMIAGGRTHGTLMPEAIALLEQRLAVLTAHLADPASGHG